MPKCLLNFGSLRLTVELFQTPIAAKFYTKLPCSIDLTAWGRELYGPIAHNLGEDNPVTHIPPGGLAYTNQGNYVCLFFGQNPAWAVEYIGQIPGEDWKKLQHTASNLQHVTISQAH